MNTHLRPPQPCFGVPRRMPRRRPVKKRVGRKLGRTVQTNVCALRPLHVQHKEDDAYFGDILNGFSWLVRAPCNQGTLHTIFYMLF